MPTGSQMVSRFSFFFCLQNKIKWQETKGHLLDQPVADDLANRFDFNSRPDFAIISNSKPNKFGRRSTPNAESQFTRIILSADVLTAIKEVFLVRPYQYSCK